MSRLVDRVIAGCEPAKVSNMIGPEEFNKFLAEQAGHQFIDHHLSGATAAPHSQFVGALQSQFLRKEPVSTEVFNVSELVGLPVIAADDVALYANSLPEGMDIADVVASMAPPFDRFFVEFQNVPNERNLHAWGALVTANDPKVISFEGQSDQPRWVLVLHTFFEYKKGRPCGPVAKHYVGLAEDGTWLRHEDGSVFHAGTLPSFSSDPPFGVKENWANVVANFIFPVLLTISFLHCKNVSTEEVQPPEKLSRAHLRRTGHNLARYHILNIAPLRKLLDKYGKTSTDDFRRALHICRGHFKTFTGDAPLLGRATGTYWWGPQVRGSYSEGLVLKDYRVEAPSQLGRAYREADESPAYADKEAPSLRDPDSAGRGLAAHNKTQNFVAHAVRELSWIPRSPTQDEPEFDLAWMIGKTLFVCEVKSLTAANEERQLRIATGQVIRYRQKLTARGFEPVIAVIAAEREPKDRSWDALCDREGIVLIWPESSKKRLREAATKFVTERV
jgi:hypothetical protein